MSIGSQISIFVIAIVVLLSIFAPCSRLHPRNLCELRHQVLSTSGTDHVAGTSCLACTVALPIAIGYCALGAPIVGAIIGAVAAVFASGLKSSCASWTSSWQSLASQWQR